MQFQYDAALAAEEIRAATLEASAVYGFGGVHHHGEANDFEWVTNSECTHDEPAAVIGTAAPLWARLARSAARYAVAFAAVYGVLSMAGVV